MPEASKQADGGEREAGICWRRKKERGGKGKGRLIRILEEVLRELFSPQESIGREVRTMCCEQKGNKGVFGLFQPRVFLKDVVSERTMCCVYVFVCVCSRKRGTIRA